MKFIQINIARLSYLLKLFDISEEDLLSQISRGLKAPLKHQEIFGDRIKLSHLKKIDNVFKKGLHFYLDPKTPVESRDASIFFRKTSFNTELNVGARAIVNHFEEEKLSLSAISKLASFKIERKLPVYTLKDNPKEVADSVRTTLYPTFSRDLKGFLKLLIGKLSDNNIFVSEFVETWNKKERANIDGFYLAPNFIVLKRQQKSFRREIFTLMHELGHYLLEEEEIEELDLQQVSKYPLASIERWCHDFAYYFLVKDYDKVISGINDANARNEYRRDVIDDVRNHTHLSRRALYTRLLLQKQISARAYNIIKEEEERSLRERQIQEQKERERQKEMGIESEGGQPKPILSPLFIKTVQIAFLEGVINESELCKKLRIKTINLEMAP